MIVDYDGSPVEFHDLQEGGIDQRIKAGLCPLSGEEKAVFNALAGPSDVVYDIGAYIGSHSIFFALKGCEVYAFEPAFRNYRRALKNCEPYPNIEVHGVAFHEKEYMCDTLFKDCNTSVSEDTLVQTIVYAKIGGYIGQRHIPHPSFIKMDIEGMETSVLKTFKFLFEGNRPTIVLDAHRHGRAYQIQRYEDNPSWLDPDEGGFDFNSLKDFQYKLFKCDTGTLELIDSEIDYNSVMGFNSFAIIPKEKI